MTHVITSLCLRDSSCVEVCPVECIIPGKPESKWPLFYIDPDTCIDCGACVPECPYEAIFAEDEIPTDYTAMGGEYLAMPEGTPGYTEVYEGENDQDEPVILKATRILDEGEVVDLTGDAGWNAAQANADYFGDDAPGYDALDM